MISYVFIIIIFLLSISVEFLILPQIISFSKKKHIYDFIDGRKTHKTPIPRIGGLSFSPVLLLSLLIVYLLSSSCFPELALFHENYTELAYLLSGLMLLLFIGFKDDLKGVNYKIKLVFQIIAALCLILGGVHVDPFFQLLGFSTIPLWINIIISVGIVVYITNSINLIDGIDGLASGLSILAMSILGAGFVSNAMWIPAMIAFGCCGVLLSFFYYNVLAPLDKKIFMGDSGSLTLGYLLSYLIIKFMSIDSTFIFNHSSHLNFIIALSVLFIPMYDTIRVMLVRCKNGKSIFMPDKNHIHHKFLSAGFSQRKALVVILFSSLSILVINLGLLIFLEVNINAIILFDLIIASLYNSVLDMKIKSFNKPKIRTSN